MDRPGALDKETVLTIADRTSGKIATSSSSYNPKQKRSSFSMGTCFSDYSTRDCDQTSIKKGENFMNLTYLWKSL